MGGDPTLIGWSVCLAYAVVALATGVAAVRTYRTDRRSGLFFGASAVTLGALSINKQLDLQVLVTQSAKAQLQDAGLLPMFRRELLIGGVVVVGLIVLALLLLCVIALYGRVRRRWRSLLGWSLVAGYVVLRVAFFNHLERTAGWEFVASSGWALLEVAGIAFIALDVFQMGKPPERAFDATPLVVLVFSLFASSGGCATVDLGQVARRTSAQLLSCDREAIEMTQIGAYRYRGVGCGDQVEVVCTAGRLEPTCLRHGGPPEGDPQPTPRAAPSERDDIEASIRAGLDRRAADIAACVGHGSVAVRVRYASDGSVDVSLQAPLNGSAEEGCVQSALSGVRTPTGAEGTVIHLVRSPPSE